MNWRTEWRALDARISGILEAGTLYFQGQVRSSEDPYGTAKSQLLPRFARIFTDLEAFHSSASPGLPTGASTVLGDFLDKNKPLFTSPSMTPEATVKAVLPTLAGFRAEFQYQVADLEVTTQRRVERGSP